MAKYIPLADIAPSNLSVKQCRARLRRSRYAPRDGRWVFTPKVADKVEELLSH